MKQQRNILILFVCTLCILLITTFIFRQRNYSKESILPEISISTSNTPLTEPKHYEVKEFSLNMGPKKLSAKQIKDHKELYAGYVNKRNEIAEALQSVDKSKANSTYSAFRSLKIAENFARNAAVLHELYFENIGTGTIMGPETQELIVDNFGSIDAFKEDLMATAIAARGWAITCYNFDDQTIQNYLLDSHYEKVPILCIPLLVIDTYEHAYMIDFGINRKEYLALLWDNIDWDIVEERVNICISHT